MNDHVHEEECRYFLTYTGITLPLKLLTPLAESNIANRNTYFRAYYDDQNRMVVCQKVVYGEMELEHRYAYYPSGTLKRAEIIEAEDDPKVMRFDEQGSIMAS